MNTSSEQIRQEPRMSLPMQSAPLWRLRIQRALFRRNTRMNRSGGCGFRGMLTMDIKNGDRRDVFCYSSDMPRLVRNDSKFQRTGNVPSVPDFKIFLLRNDMGLRNWTPKVTAFVIIGSVITVLFMIGISEFWKHDFRS